MNNINKLSEVVGLRLTILVVTCSLEIQNLHIIIVNLLGTITLPTELYIRVFAFSKNSNSMRFMTKKIV